MIQKSVCVYCGSRPGDDPEYTAQADALGRALAPPPPPPAQTAGGTTFGVIPDHLVKWEVGKTDLTTYVVTETMHERKKVMFMNCDAVVVLPGGAGSLDELFEVLTWRQLGLHQKPVILLNTNGYWDPLTALLDHVVARGFAEESLLGYVDTVDDVDGALDVLRRSLTA